MNENQFTPIQLAEGFISAFAMMDFETALSFLSDDVEYTNIPFGTVHGQAAVRELLEPLFAPIRENDFRILRRAESESIVFLERLDRHRYDDGWRELPVNGVFEVHDGKITVWRDYFDFATAATVFELSA